METEGKRESKKMGGKGRERGMMDSDMLENTLFINKPGLAVTH